MSIFFFLAAILVVLKLAHVIDISWFAALTPLIVEVAIFVATLALGAGVARRLGRR